MDEEVLLVDKPAGMSSFGVVARVRRKLSEAVGHKVKVGHTGTLDPFATGLMILVIGKGTKRAAEFSKLDKVYEAKIRLGATSTTGDPEGEITIGQFVEPHFARLGQNDNFASSSENDSPAHHFALPGKVVRGSDRFSELGKSVILTGENIRSANCPIVISRAVSSFVGEVEQTPPVFSAIKIKGQRAYRLARKGVEVEMPKRKVQIYSIEILDYAWPYLRLKIHVSSGTYIRSLAADIGEKLGCGAYVESLRRTRVGEYDVGEVAELSR